MTRVKKAVRVFIATLQEIFDEAAYTRFLQMTQTTGEQCAQTSLLLRT